MLPRRLRERDGVFEDFVVRLHTPDGFADGFDLARIGHGFDFFERPSFDLLAHDFHLRRPLRIAHARDDGEAVELPLRKRVRPVEVVRVLLRHDEERLG